VNVKTAWPPRGMFVLLLLVLLVFPGEVSAQGVSAPSFRPYFHVFVAYAIAWGLMLAWLISIARRLGRVEQRLGRQADGNPG
jgi:protein-S-isoprenylcysteine O-methyltransferase Ste14